MNPEETLEAIEPLRLIDCAETLLAYISDPTQEKAGGLCAFTRFELSEATKFLVRMGEVAVVQLRSQP